MSRTLCVTLALLAASCATAPETGQPRPQKAKSLNAVEAARSFVRALNRLDSEAAAALIDWDLWIAGDARLTFLLASLREDAKLRPPTPEELAAHPIEGSDVTLADLLDPKDAAFVVSRVSRERFKTVMTEDFAPDTRKNDARLASWNLDRVDRSATIFMPNGETVEMELVFRERQWRLVPRWYPR